MIHAEHICLEMLQPGILTKVRDQTQGVAEERIVRYAVFEEERLQRVVGGKQREEARQAIRAWTGCAHQQRLQVGRNARTKPLQVRV